MSEPAQARDARVPSDESTGRKSGMARDPYRYFRVEARELLDQLVKAALDLEKAGAGPEQVSRLLRLAHTLKGAARVVRQGEVSDLAHSLEDLLGPYRDGAEPVPKLCVDGVLAIFDVIASKLAQLAGPPAEADVPLPGTIAAPTAAVRADLSDVDILMEGLGEVHGELAAMRRIVESAQRARTLSSLLAQQLASPGLVDAQRPPHHHATRFAKLRSMADDLHAITAGFEHHVAASVDRMQRELRQARELAERIRLVPAGSLFSALERVARDAAHGAGKHIAFEASGADVRLDGPVVDAMLAALVQLVRNAVVHGIEADAERRRAGKPVEGRVAVEVTRHAHRVSFVCRDDGCGVDLEAVRGVLRRKGALPDGAEQLASADLLNLLFKGGITTSGAVTELAGRGIGLDVVREVAERLGGEVSVQTVQGRGTRVELRVPVSLASLEALIVESGGQTAALPLSAVRGALRVAPRTAAHTPQGEALLYDDRLVPLVSEVAGILPATRAGGRAVSAVIVAGAGTAATDAATVAIGVDRVLGAESIMLRPLPALTPVDAVVSGVYLDAEGHPRPVLDPEVLVNPLRRPAAEAPPAQVAAHRILVIDDSLTTRMLEQSILESAGYAVELATSGEEALDLARKNRFDLFLVDVEMPGMDGFSFIEKARADPLLRDVPSVLVTSRDSVADRRRGEAAGARGYIVKSEFDQLDFLDRIAGLVRR